MSHNFALGKAAPRRGAFTHITGVTPQIIKNTTSGQAKLAALLEGSNRKLEGESLQTPQIGLGKNIKTPQPRDLSGSIPLPTEGKEKIIISGALPAKGKPKVEEIISRAFPVMGKQQ